MESTQKELITSMQYIQIMSAMKELFRDAIQQVMKGKFGVELCYDGSERMSDSVNDNLSKNYRNGYSKKTFKM